MFPLIVSNGRTLSQTLVFAATGILLLGLLTSGASLQTQPAEEEKVKEELPNVFKLHPATAIKNFSLSPTVPPNATDILEPSLLSLNPFDQLTPHSDEFLRVITGTGPPHFVSQDKKLPLNDNNLQILNEIALKEELGEKNRANLSAKYLSDASVHSSVHPQSKVSLSSSSSSIYPISSSNLPSTHTSFLPFSFSSFPSSFAPITESTTNDLSTFQASAKEINEIAEARPSAAERANMSSSEGMRMISKEIKLPSNEQSHKSEYKMSGQKEEDQRNGFVKAVEKNESHHKQLYNSYPVDPKENLQFGANNELNDPFLLSFTGMHNKNITNRLSEIVSSKNKPKKFIAMFRAAQQSKNFEDPFTLSSILHESSLDNILTADSGAFSEGQKKLRQSSFRGISNEPKKSKQRKNEHQNPYERIISAMTSVDTRLDSDVLEVSNRFKESIAHGYNATTEIRMQIPSVGRHNKIIYQEISGALHIDTSIDDIKDDNEAHEKTTETSNFFLTSVNTSRVNLLQPELQTINFKKGTESTGKSPLIDNAKKPSSFSASEKDEDRAASDNVALSVDTSSKQDVSGMLMMIDYDTSAGLFPENDSLDEEQRGSQDESWWTGEQDGRVFNRTRITSIKKWDVLATTQATEKGEGNITSKEESENRYYSFFGYKARKNSDDTTGISYISVGDHNQNILAAQADRMEQVMDSSVDPCDDFYEFACGKWSEVYPLEDKALDNTFDRLREGLDEVLKLLLEEPVTNKDSNATKAAKILYRGCMNEEQIEALGMAPLKTLLRELGGWPVIEGKSWNESAFDWVELMANLRNFNNDILLSEWVAADITNSSQHIIQLDQPELGLPGREYFLSAGDQSYRMAYMELMLKTCQLLGANPLTALEDMIDVLQFEKQLAQILIPAEERRNLSAVHLRLTVEELQTEIPQINWNSYFKIVAPLFASRQRYVIVFAMKYIRRLVDLVQTTSKRTVSNYLMWRFVKNRMNNLGTQALEAKQEFIQVLFGSKSQPERWLFCVSYVNGNLGHVLGALFVKKYYPQSSKKDSEKMIHLIRESFTEAIAQTNWMEQKTRQVAEKKVFAMVRNVGYPEYILNATYMDHMYSQLSFNESDHFWNVIKMLRFHAQSSHKLLQKAVSRTEWTTTPAVVNAYYSRSKNMIMFPAGILQPPFYHPAFPRCLNFGGIGVVIGHEISHGFDDRGRQFDDNGNLHQWWSEEDVSHFYDRATCMLDQYSNYEIESVGLKINAVNTLGENIADNAGLKIAYKAYQRWKDLHGEETIQLPRLNFSHDQLFFLNFGQIWCEVNSPEAMLTKIRGGQHSPNKYRVIGTLSNSIEFSEAFRCPEGAPMNPTEKCQVW